MKKFFLAASLIIAATSFTAVNSANASIVSVASKGDGQHIPASQVPAPVITSFNSDFPTATQVKWEKEKEHGQTVYQADFMLNGKRWRAEYAPDGTLLSSGRR